MLQAAGRDRAGSRAASVAPSAARGKASVAVLEPAEANAARVVDTELHVEAETSYIAVRPGAWPPLPRPAAPCGGALRVPRCARARPGAAAAPARGLTRSWAGRLCAISARSGRGSMHSIVPTCICTGAIGPGLGARFTLVHLHPV